MEIGPRKSIDPIFTRVTMIMRAFSAMSYRVHNCYIELGGRLSSSSTKNDPKHTVGLFSLILCSVTKRVCHKDHVRRITIVEGSIIKCHWAF